MDFPQPCRGELALSEQWEEFLEVLLGFREGSRVCHKAWTVLFTALSCTKKIKRGKKRLDAEGESAEPKLSRSSGLKPELLGACLEREISPQHSSDLAGILRIQTQM